MAKSTKTKQEEFERRTKILGSIRAVYNTDYEFRGEGKDRKEYRLPLFTNIRIPLAPEEWFELCSREGIHYIGGCCGAASEIQDHLNSWLRDGGWVDCKKLELVAIAWGNHEGGEDFKKKPKTSSIEDMANKFNSLDPWGKILVCWYAIQGFYNRETPVFQHTRKSAADNAISDIHHLSMGLSLLTMFEKDGHSDHYIGNKAEYFAQIYPPLKKAVTLIESQVEDFEGHCLFDTQTDAIAMNGLGYCVFSAKKDAQGLLKQWVKEDLGRKNRRKDAILISNRIKIRKLKISPKFGITFID